MSPVPAAAALPAQAVIARQRAKILQAPLLLKTVTVMKTHQALHLHHPQAAPPLPRILKRIPAPPAVAQALAATVVQMTSHQERRKNKYLTFTFF